MFAATKRLTATGGVIVPMARFTVIITPNQTGSQPKRASSGRKMGKNT